MSPRYFKKSKPIETEDGIQARSRRGDIGEQWWSRRFVEVVESYSISNRIRRGKRYARKGQVLELIVDTGEVTAAVQGSRPTPYRVSIGGAALDDDQWSRVEEALASRAAFVAQLLAGQMPPDIEEAFAECDHSLFPRSYREMSTRCSCPDSANPCKHLAAVFFLLAERFDDNPFAMLQWRGRYRDQLLENLRALRGDGDPDSPHGTAAPEEVLCVDDNEAFWRCGDEIDEVDFRIPNVSVPDATLQALGDAPSSIAELREELSALYHHMLTGR